ncbi:uncharacterized protein LOC143864114 isoform X1 [Tasmannia lanceolata]|uniref:uncharacterized protein LOC143864114 isoform X1 n=1 Tax=Tasmannia lanceolata TaxID=3420 RepID=UPI004063D9F9
MKWVKVESIGADCIFFLGIGSGCVYYTTNTRLKGDVIYFLNSEDNAFYAFDLEDGSLSVNLCGEVGDNVCDTQFWLLPHISFGYENMELVKFEGCFPSPERAPWLVFPLKESQLFLSISRGKCDVRNIRPWNKVWVSSHGWLVIEDKKYFLLLLQPMSMEKIKIPRPDLNGQPSRFKCFLPLPPTDPNWVIFFMHQDCSLCLVFRQGDTKWGVYYHKAPAIQHVVSLKGKFYAHTFRDRLAVVEIFPLLQVTKLEVEPVIEELTYDRYFTFKYLLESRGELFLVYKHNYACTKTFHNFFYFQNGFL